MTNMPEITYKGSTSEEVEILKRICIKGHLRATPPPKPKMKKVKDGEDLFDYHFEYFSEEDQLRGHSRYVWRMVAFLVSPKSEHHCMPVLAQFDLASYREEYLELDKLVDKIVEAIPKDQWGGVIRWGRALSHMGV